MNRETLNSVTQFLLKGLGGSKVQFFIIANLLDLVELDSMVFTD